MTKTAVWKIAGVAAVLLLALSAYAGTTTITLYSPATVNGKQLPAGDYEVKVSGSGPVAEVTFLRGRKEMATAKAKRKDLGRKPSGDAVVISRGADGARTVSAIEFAGKSEGLELENGAPMADNTGGK